MAGEGRRGGRGDRGSGDVNRQFRFSLRWLLAFITIACVVLSALQYSMQWLTAFESVVGLLAAACAVACSVYVASRLESADPLPWIQGFATGLARLYFGFIIGAMCGVALSIPTIFLRHARATDDWIAPLAQITSGSAVAGAVASFGFHAIYRWKIAAECKKPTASIEELPARRKITD